MSLEDVPWADIPTGLLQAELQRRQADELKKPECGSKIRWEYNTSIHVFALFLILVLSAASCAFPIVVKRFPRFPIPHQFLFLSRHFGTGVLIATAFVHLLPTAYTSLTDPCLPAFWNEGYPAMPGFIAMTSVFAVVGIEMYFATKGAGHVHVSEYGNFVADEEDGADPGDERRLEGGTTPVGNGTLGMESRRRGLPNGLLSNPQESAENLITETNSPVSRHPAPSKTLFDADNPSNDDAATDHDSDLDIDLDELHGSTTHAPSASSNPLLTTHPHTHNHKPPTAASHPSHRRTLSTTSSHSGPFDAAAHSRALLQCLLLEAGILFHSIFIGMSLSVSTGPPFAVLLIAISFHQTFEGLALGARIAALHFPPRAAAHPWLMALAYGTTTPLGQALGLALHSAYDPQSQTGLLVVGLTNAVSSGLLIFAGLVELLAEDFLSEASYTSLRGRRRLQACAAVVAGALLMALVGAWA